MPFLVDTLAYADLTALKAVPIANIVDRQIAHVANPATGYVSTTYTFNAASTASELLPVIATPDDSTGTGAWVSNMPLYIDTALPSAAPPIVGMLWVANLTNPTRTVVFRAVNTSAATDWQPTGNKAVEDSGAGFPSFNADFQGQIYYDDNASQLVIALDTSGGWQTLGGAVSNTGTGYGGYGGYGGY